MEREAVIFEAEHERTRGVVQSAGSLGELWLEDPVIRCTIDGTKRFAESAAKEIGVARLAMESHGRDLERFRQSFTFRLSYSILGAPNAKFFQLA